MQSNTTPGLEGVTIEMQEAAKLLETSDTVFLHFFKDYFTDLEIHLGFKLRMGVILCRLAVKKELFKELVQGGETILAAFSKGNINKMIHLEVQATDEVLRDNQVTDSYREKTISKLIDALTDAGCYTPSEFHDEDVQNT